MIARALVLFFICAVVSSPASSTTFLFDAVFVEHASFGFDNSNANPHVYGDTSNLPNLAAGLSVGDVVHGSFSYDPLAVPNFSDIPLDLPHGFQRWDGQGISLTLPAGAWSFDTSNIVLTDEAADGPNFEIWSPTSALPASSSHAITYSLAVYYPEDSRINILHLPTAADLEAILGYAILSAVDSVGREDYFFQMAKITSLPDAGDAGNFVADTPLPATLPLFGSAVVIGFILRQRKSSIE